EEKAQALASQAAALAGELGGTDPMEMNEKTVMLEALSEQAERLIASAPDAIVASEQEKWAGELEAISTHLQALKGSLNLLALPHVSGAQRANHEKRVRALLTAAKLRLSKAHAGIRRREHVEAHPLVVRLRNIHKAMGAVRKSVGQSQARAQAGKLEAQASAVGAQMRSFLQRQLNGRMYVDWSTIQFRSDLTGQVVEWPHDAVHHQALMQILAGTPLTHVLSGMQARKNSSMAAGFECSADASGLVVELTAGERSIIGDTIVYKPHVARISV
ncbi:MAG: hypothetical protein KGH63_03820, partial [Candidatus Micrarchaeota archaeon]|nr:hypothetical protein [Candidatus Micrarchaeota archaeon]